MPCFHDLVVDQFVPIGPAERRFIEAIVGRAPEILTPILTQLDTVVTCDDGTGWLVVRNARGDPCDWPMGHPFDVLPPDQGPGAQDCYSIMLWFHDDGQLQAVELLMLENGRLELAALTEWLEAMA